MVAQYLVGKVNANIKQILLICADWKQTIVVLLLTTAYYLKATKTYKADNCEKYQHHYFYIFHFVLSQFSPTWDH